MDSNSSSYLILGATLILFTIVFAFLSGLKRKRDSSEIVCEEQPPLELRTTHFSQILSYLWIPILLGVPVLVFKEIHPIPYFVLILVLLVVLFCWFIAARHSLEKDHEEES